MPTQHVSSAGALLFLPSPLFIMSKQKPGWPPVIWCQVNYTRYRAIRESPSIFVAGPCEVFGSVLQELDSWSEGFFFFLKTNFKSEDVRRRELNSEPWAWCRMLTLWIWLSNLISGVLAEMGNTIVLCSVSGIVCFCSSPVSFPRLRLLLRITGAFVIMDVMN